jgi:hypothetical protein
MTPRDIVKNLLNAAAGQAPGGIGTVLKLIIDNLIFPKFLDGWLFPKPETDIFKQFEKRIDKMIEKRLEVAIGQAAFERVKANLSGLADAFRDFAHVVDFEERKVRQGYLLTLVDVTVAEVESVPDRYLYLLTDKLQIVAVLNIAVLIDQVKLYPEHYEYQLALNKAAIRYSEMAGRIRDRFLWYRLGQIAEGKGVVEQEEVATRQPPGLGAQKKIRFIAYDDFKYWWNNPYGYRDDFLNFFTSGWVQAVGMDTTYQAAIKEAQDRVGKYGEQEKQKVYDWWDEHLTKTTADFMQFVDWPGEQGERKPKDRMLTCAFPVQPMPALAATGGLLDRIDLFIGQQMDQFRISGPRYVQTYRLPGTVHYGEHDNIFHRADTYDTAVAAIYLALRGDLRRARDLADGLCSALEHDAKGGGRIVAATKATALIDDNDNYATSVFYTDGGTYDIGNMCWAGIALTRIYAKTGQYRYLHNAQLIGSWIIANCTVDDPWAGFSGGEDSWGGKRPWRSVEHNVDAYALFRNLQALTGDASWQEAANRARTLVIACRLPAGYYVTGTGAGQKLNAGVVPTDTQSWTALAGIDPGANAASLGYMVDNLTATSAGFAGFRFALAGSEVQNEVSAGAAMALYLQGGELREKSMTHFASLERQQREAKGMDGYGLVATPADQADTGAGLGWKYFNWPHVASSAWTGLAFLAKDDEEANPYKTVTPPKPSGG